MFLKERDLYIAYLRKEAYVVIYNCYWPDSGGNFSSHESPYLEEGNELIVAV